jgi:phosphatidylglycerol lysyltransferase
MSSPTPPQLARDASQRPALVAAASVALFALALWVLHRELAHTHAGDIRRALAALPWPVLGLAVLGTAASYLALTGYDALALRQVGAALPYRRIAVASFIATAVGHNLGMALFTASAVRLRAYTAWGLSAAQVTVMAGVVALTFGIGVTFSAGLALLLEPGRAVGLLHVEAPAARILGALLLVAVLAYVAMAWRGRRSLRIGDWQVPLPSPDIAVGQVALALIDLAFAALALWVLLPQEGAPSYAAFLGVYVLAVLAGIVSHVPGGIGVFESVLLLALPDVPRDALLAAALGYRFIYYLLPLALAALLGAALTIHERRAQLLRTIDATRPLFDWLAPMAASACVFAAGVLLLLSGSLPAARGRMDMLRDLVPLPVVEMSHLAGSLLGLGLVILSRALWRRIAIAYHLAFWMLVLGAAASLLKGIDFEEALVASLVLGVLWLGRRAFDRRAALIEDGLSAGWLAALALVLVGTAWLGTFAFRHVEYSQELWWHFAFRADAPRYLRATLLVTVAAIGIVLWQALRPAPPEPIEPQPQDIERAAGIVARAPTADAALALLGDKRLLFAADGDAFLMYQVRGSSWISMGDPVGSPAAIEGLAWRFREIADRHGGRTVFYQADAAQLPLYLDLGLSAIKLGEEAVVPLAGFSLDGPRRRDLRQARHRAQRDGLAFEVVDAVAVPPLIATLGEISTAWLAHKQVREKGFSLGRFEPGYLARFPAALVRHEGRIVAFANVWTSGAKHELSADLMRHMPDAPSGVMDFLFVELMLWGAREGWQQFNLGMAPLAGLETHPLAPLWHRLGTAIFRQGEHFYNFQGLRAYKAKFDPQWQPKYLVAPGGFALPGVLLDVAALIAGGVKGVIAR